MKTQNASLQTIKIEEEKPQPHQQSGKGIKQQAAGV